MSARPAPKSRLLSLLRDEHGYSAAEKALAAVLALGLILMVTRVLLGGASTAADTVQQTLEGQSVGVNWSDGPESGAGLPGGGSSPSGNTGDSGSGSDDDSGGFWGTVASISHVVLGIGTMIPVIGTPCALVDAGIYTAQGDYINAGISVLAAIPVEGDVVEAARGTEQIVVGTAEIVESANAGEKVVHEGTELAEAANGEKGASNAAKEDPQAGMCNGSCFTADTAVMTPSGPQPIAQIQAGDLVLSQDEVTGEQRWKPVLQQFVTPNRQLLALRLQAANGTIEVIRTTVIHPFYVAGRGFVEAGALHPGDTLVNADSAPILVVSSMQLEQSETVYNLEIESFHTYFVGNTQAWVHNQAACTPCPEGSGSGQTAGSDKIPRYDGQKPEYEVNPAHDTSQGRLRPGKTPLPSDAEAVYKTAVPDASTNARNWYGMNSEGKIYRYSNSNDGKIHYSGTEDVGDGIRNITDYALKRLGRK